MRERSLSAGEQVLALATKRAIEAAGGLALAAGETGKSTSQLSRCGSSEHADSLSIADAATIDTLGEGTRGAPFVLNALARLQNKIVIDGPGVVADPDSLAASVMELTCELGDVATEIRLAMADGTLNKTEIRSILRQLDELEAATAKLRAKLMALLESTLGEDS